MFAVVQAWDSIDTRTLIRMRLCRCVNKYTYVPDLCSVIIANHTKTRWEQGRSQLE